MNGASIYSRTMRIRILTVFIACFFSVSAFCVRDTKDGVALAATVVAFYAGVLPLIGWANDTPEKIDSEFKAAIQNLKKSPFIKQTIENAPLITVTSTVVTLGLCWQHLTHTGIGVVDRHFGWQRT